MKINLSTAGSIHFHTPLYQGTFRKSQVSFCKKILAKLGAIGETCQMIVRLKNPKKAGFTAVKLTNERGFWEWSVPSQVELFKGDDKAFWDMTTLHAISDLFPGQRVVTVWVKFEKA
jgi:hypothetical protein